MNWDQEVDCAGLLCPLPVLRARKRLIDMQPGQVLRVIATDKMAAIDLPHFCSESGHLFISETPIESGTAYLIQRGK